MVIIISVFLNPLVSPINPQKGAPITDESVTITEQYERK